MDTTARMDLNMTSIAAIPKQDERRTILGFVRSQQSFAKAYAKEGKTYMASWKDETGTSGSNSERERPIASCGFATPVLKPRTRRRRAGISSRGDRHTKRGKELDSQPECSVDNAHKNIQAKSPERPARREEQRRKSPKRGPDLQTDEEQRLQERREKKKARRDVMKPELQKKKQADIELQSKTKKKKQKLASGLALMYGFTASNVGQKRLTVGPLSRPGVFGKGKASVQAAVGKSKQKSFRNNAVFSESAFLKSAGKDHLKKGGTSCSSESDTTSSECTDDQDRLEREPRVRRVNRNSPKPKAATQSGPVIRQEPDAVATNTPKALEQNSSTNSSPRKASSVVWDIEKDDGVLPMNSSPLASLGPKPSTLLLDVAQKGWTLERSRTIGNQEVEPRMEQADLAVAAKSPSVQSIRPSESPSQVNNPAGQNHPEGVSKYFSLGPPPPVECRPCSPKDTDLLIQIPDATIHVPTVSPEVDTSGPPDDGAKGPAGSDVYKLDSEPELFFSEEITQYPRRDLDNTDWLLSDPFLGGYPTSPFGPIEDDWAILEDMLETPIDGGYENDQAALEQMDSPYEESPHDGGGHSLWLGEDPLPDYFSDEFLGFNGYDDIPDLEQASDEDIQLEQNALTDIESDASDSDLREHVELSREDIRNTESDHLICFNEGRYLLHGYRISGAVNNLEIVEADVAQSLIGHWKPQKY
ncbi:hypothetical protein Agabi119p4_4613 [Agaricus bisporus var. burnettii]|uniref:Uncharacterized protein n=1 Tax=Agaricus bisporus var. burnettii TaxID=192524 RepID=A0A8H7KHG5_AGABI|nr:hypothetical protein Agabi119p4_4613 [Agaricus bisporus var. burnettii]